MRKAIKKGEVKKVDVIKYDIGSDLTPGRHPCECQARTHKLISNCMGCGRIVCEQEGSGPCFYCSELVCTKEEQEILDRKSKKSEQLLNKLMGHTSSQNGSGLSLSAISKNMQQAIDYRNKLLVADADTERQTRVNDLENDYYNLENNPYLTKDERDVIIARKEELRQMRMKREKTLTINLDLANATATKSDREELETASDPVIQAVLTKSQFRKPQISDQSLLEEQRKAINEFVPKYDVSYSSDLPNVPLSFNEDLMVQDEEAIFAEVERKGYCIALEQPTASFVVYGLKRHLPWSEDMRLKGPILIASTVNAPSADRIKQEQGLLKQRIGLDKPIEFPLDYPNGGILGRALVYECLTYDEYQTNYPNGECANVKNGFVLIFKNAEPLLVSIPHIPPAKFYQVKRELRNTVKQLLDPYSLS